MYGKIVLFRKVVSAYNIRFYKERTHRLLEFLADMPKANSARIVEAQRQRQQISKKSQNYGSSTVYLQVLGSGARGAPNTLYLFTDQKRYLFNCGESTQRLAHEHKVKLTRLDHIFITSKTWRNIGGLPGLSLTLQDVGVPNITLHGPDGLDELYKATKRFVIMKDMNVTMAKCSPSKDFVDNVMTVKYVLLGKDDIPDLKPAAKKPKLSNSPEDEALEEFFHDNTDYYQREVKNTERTAKNNYGKANPKVSPERDTAKKKQEKVLNDLQKRSDCTVAYICTLKKRLGSLCLEKCVEFGVKPGPLLGQLKNGHDVILPDGRLVQSKDVKTPDDPGPVFIVLDVPELSYLKEAEFSQHFDNGVNPKENIPAVIVHYTPPHVFHHPTYQAFLSMFGPSTKHLILNRQNSCLGSEAVHRTQHKLHQLDPDIFPLLKDASVPAVWNTPPVPKADNPTRLKGLEELKNRIALAQFQSIITMEEASKRDKTEIEHTDAGKLEVIAGRTLTMYHLRPQKGIDRSAEPKLHIQDYIQESMDVDGFVASLERFRKLVDGIRFTNMSGKDYPKVIFLGTGSCIPSKTRNTSAIVVQIDDSRSMLLDCGEGAFGQLVRFFGPKRVNSFLRTLKAIYVSHLHADHHIGLIGILQARREAILETQSEAPYEPVHLLAPGQIVSWLSLYDQQFEKIRADFTLIPNQSLLDEKLDQTVMTPAVLASIGAQEIKTCLVSHCPNAFGVAMVLDGHKITYSGDTIPCQELVKIGQNSTLLIHEATMEDELADEARVKMHSTTSQAIEVGRRMGARYTVLTHFSQRYARLPRLSANILHDNASVGIAFDNMQITMDDLKLLPHMYAPLQLMFAEHCVELELKAAHRARQRERRNKSPTSAVVETREKVANELPAPLQSSVSSPTKVVRSGRSPDKRFKTSSTLVKETAVNSPVTVVKDNSRSKSSSSIKNSTICNIVRPLSAFSRTMNYSGTTCSDKELVGDTSGVNARKPTSASSISSTPLSTEKTQSPSASNSGSVSNVRPPVSTDVFRHTPLHPSSGTNANPSPKVKGMNVSQNSKPLISPVLTRPRFNTSPKIQTTTTVPPKSPPGIKIARSNSPRIEKKQTENVKNGHRINTQRETGSKPNQTENRESQKLKNTFCQDVQPVSISTRPNFASKRYKPELEDIKSSFLLLNKRKVNRNIEWAQENAHKKGTHVKKPTPLNESERRKQLLEAKNKYKSKSYWNDSRYNKIEGLNWITWK